jgi:aspartyl-tRNA synthetase
MSIFPLFQNKPVRGIVADCSGRSRSFFENSLKFATGIGMKGLGYITLTDGKFKGPIEKFLSDGQKQQLIGDLGIAEGQTLFFICDAVSKVNSFSGQIRDWLGETLELIDRDLFAFCFIVDFPMYERNPDTKQIEFTHNPFSMPQGGP